MHEEAEELKPKQQLVPMQSTSPPPERGRAIEWGLSSAPATGQGNRALQASGSGGHKPTPWSHLFFMVAGLYHFPINAG